MKRERANAPTTPMLEAASGEAAASPSRSVIWPVLPALAALLLTGDWAIGVTPDSLNYLRAAENVAHEGYFGADYLHWPPLYPALLALHGLFAVNVMTFAICVSKILQLSTLAGFWLIARNVAKSAYGLAFGLLVLVCIPQFQFVFSTVWSEGLYIPLCIWTVFFWMRYLRETNGYRDLLLASVFLALALLTRHVGVVLAFALVLSIQRIRTRSLNEKLVALAATIAATIPYFFWVLRTWKLSGTIGGPRVPLQGFDPLQKFELFGRVIWHWFAPHSYLQSHGIIIAAVFLGAALLAPLHCFLVTPRTQDFLRSKHGDGCWLISLLTLFIVGHALLTIITAARYTLDVDNRTIFPIFWPTLLLSMHALMVLSMLARSTNSRFSIQAVEILIVGYCTYWFLAPNSIINTLVS